MIIILFIFILLFIPIPLKITLHYSNECYYFKFYRVVLFSNNGGLINKILQKKSSKNDNSSKTKAEPSNEDNISNKSKKRLSLSLKKLFFKIKNNPFKPNIKFHIDGSYSLEDAALSAMSYGLISNLNPILYCIFSIIFKVKTLKINVNPQFLNKTLVNFTISSIISFNLAKIIYMLFLVLKCVVKK